MQESFNQYSLTTELAKKHSHVTYLASPVNSQRGHGNPEHQVILTVFSASVFHFPHERESLLQKAQCVKEFQHPHLLPILDLGVEEEQPFVVREYLPNDSLRSRLKKIPSHRLELRDALTIALEVGEGLTYAYQQNIIHGNIKPENILFNANGQAMLTDFYLVGRKDAIIRDQTAGEYAFCYMAPEQFAGISDARSDQYALGCLVYELITGCVPFAAQTLASMMGQTSDALLVPLSESVADLPPSLEVAILKALAKNPDERFFDFSLFLEVMRSVLSPPPAFPLLRPANSHKHRFISRPMQSVKVETISSPIRKRTTKHAVPQPFEPSGPFSSAEEQQPNTSIGIMPPPLEAATDDQATPILLTNQDTDDILFTDPFTEEGDGDELSEGTPTAARYTLCKNTVDTTTFSSTKNNLAHKVRSAWTTRKSYSKRKMIGLVFLILVIGASSTYAIFLPFSTIPSDLLRHPIQAMRQGGIFPPIPLQGPSTPNAQPAGDNTNTANGQNDTIGTQIGNTQSPTQNKGISTEQSPSQIVSQGSSSPSSPSSTSSSPASSSPAPALAPTRVPTTNMTIYFSGWTDNSPPGASIAYPQIHQTAGGTGTYSDPITFAASANALSPGTIIYVSFLEKYFIMEDDCSSCDTAWNNNYTYQVSLWIGGDANTNASAQQSCENSLTPNSPQPVEVKPPSNNTVDTTPLFTDGGGCIKL